jgi:hypothetical protein
MSVTDVIKESLHYPFNDKKKILYLGIFYAIIGAFSTGISYLISNPILNPIKPSLFEGLSNVTTFTQAVNLVSSQIPTINLYYITILGIISIILGILATGYDFRVIKNAINKNIDLPKFDRFPKMFIEGLKIIIVELVYAILPILLFTISFSLFLFRGNSTYNNTLMSIASLIFILGLLITIFLILVQIMAVNHMIANKGKLSFAFKFKEIIEIISSISWIRYIGALFMLLIISAIIGFAANVIISIITFGVMVVSKQIIISALISTIIVGLFINPFLALFTDRALGSLYNERVKSFDIDDEYII